MFPIVSRPPLRPHPEYRSVRKNYTNCYPFVSHAPSAGLAIKIGDMRARDLLEEPGVHSSHEIVHGHLVSWIVLCNEGGPEAGGGSKANAFTCTSHAEGKRRTFWMMLSGQRVSFNYQLAMTKLAGVTNATSSQTRRRYRSN